MPREVIRSKYFCKQVMEESLNDFQQTKTKCIGPKIIKKTKQKAKPKKRVKGQKDIRTLIQKKNELIAFTKDFNNVCAKSGVDIDSQELQLAIALSKSLHEQSQPDAGCSQSNKSLTSQERTNQIRRTLQEYGFKVPETKIKLEGNKRVKKYKKHYKLLLITEEERREKISDKYSRILFQYPDPEEFYQNNHGTDKVNEGLYYLGTNISYNLMKNNGIFHITNILQEISVNKGSLLKDWSDIPGRPCSPVLVRDFRPSILDIDYTQAELNTILSGTLKSTKEIFNSKLENSSEISKSDTESELLNQCEEQNKDNTCNLLPIHPGAKQDKECKDISVIKTLENSTKHTEITMISSPSKDRSLSPDLFGDDASSIIDNTIIHNFCKITTPKHNKSTDNMHKLDLTEDTIINILPESHHLVGTGTSDLTKRKSNDFMDLTECVTTFSQRHKTNLLSQNKACESKVLYNDCMEITECLNPSSPKFNNVNVKGVQNIETHTDLITENDSLLNRGKATSLDLTELSDSDDELPRIEIFCSQKCLPGNTRIVSNGDCGQIANNEDVIELDSEKIDSIPFIEDESPHTSDNNHKSIPVEEISKNISSNLLETSVIDLTQSLEDVNVEQDDSVSITKDLFCVSTNNKSETIPDEDFNGNHSSILLEINDEDVTQSSENVHIEENNSVSFIKDGVCVSGNNKSKSMAAEEVNANHSSSLLQINDGDIIQPSENVSIEKTNSESFTKGVVCVLDSNESKSISYGEVNGNDSSSLLEINDGVQTQSSVDGDIEKDKSLSLTKDICSPTSDNSMIVKEVNENISNDHLEICEIDLTQSSNSSMDSPNPIHHYNIPCDEYDNLGKIGDVSIDYDEVCVDTQIINDYCPDEQFDDILSKYGTSSNNDTALTKSSMENSRNNPVPGCSNTSEVFKLSDREINDSLCKSNKDDLKSGNISIVDNNFSLDDSDNVDDCKSRHSLNRPLNDSPMPFVKLKEKYIKLNESIHSTPIKAIIRDDKISVETPANSEYLIKVRAVTPMPDYAAMLSPERNQELEKYGLKPFKRKRAIQLLTHLYNQTHPIVEYCADEPIPAKKLRMDSPNKNINLPKNTSTSPVTREPVQPFNPDLIYKETKDVPDIRDIECSSEDWFFQKIKKAKIHTCRVPLHIVFHNYVSCRRGLREAILRYEPVNIEAIHKDLVSYGYRYNPKDLSKFLDRKCITVKTADNNGRNSRH